MMESVFISCLSKLFSIKHCRSNVPLSLFKQTALGFGC